MRNLFLAVAVAALLSPSARAIASSRSGPPLCSAATAGTPSAEVAELRRQLSAREAELARLRASVDALDAESHHRIARETGVIDAVAASGLPGRQQQRIATAIVREAKRHGIDPLLVVAVIRTESSFDNYAVSPAGAMGLMQVMPGTGSWLMKRRGARLGRRTNLFDSELNIEIGTAYLAELLARFGSVEKALIAYNAGPGAAARILANRAARTKFMAGYPRKVLGELRNLKIAAQARLADQAPVRTIDGRG
jgi:soluble lytic murein transglycosylase